MDALDSVVTVPTIGLALGTAIVTLMLRRLIELQWPTLSKKTAPSSAQMVWERLVLPGMPVILCVTFCLLARPQHFEYPAVALKSTLSRVIYGIGVGWFADFGYRALVFFLKKKWNVTLPGASDAPGPTEEAEKTIVVQAHDPLPPAPPSSSEEVTKS